MLEEMLDWFREHVLLSVILAAGLILIIILLVLVAREPHEAPEADSNTHTEDSSTPSAVLTDQQKAVDQTENLADELVLGILKANTWANPSGSSTIAFSDYSFTERTNANPQSVSLVVVDILEERDTVLEEDVQVQQTTWYIDCLGADDKFFFVKVVRIGTDDQADLTVTSDAFSQKNYLRVAPSENIAVESLNDQALSLIDNRLNELTATLGDYCSLNYPVATRAAFAGEATVSYDEDTVTMKFTLDTRARTTLTVIYDVSAQAFTIGR